jgi:AGZA family xanthine/uracil permease-like MFS transporter
MQNAKHVDWGDRSVAIPVFLTVVLMPFTYSISNGIGAGIIAYVVIKLARGKAREVHPLLYGVALLFVIYFLRGPIEAGLF